MADPVFKELAYQALANNIIGGLETTAANPMTGVVDPYRGTAATANIPMLRRSARLQNVQRPVSISPLQLARGWAAGTAGLPGDIESLGRMVVGADGKTYLPTSEELLGIIPYGATDETGKRAAEVGTMFGGLGVGTGAKAAGAGARALAPEIGDLAERYMAATGGLMYARPSKAEAVAAGLYHPIGEGKKLKKPVSEMKYTQETIKDLPERTIITPEQLQGATFIPATGDRTAAGKLLTEIEGVRLPNPVLLEGGPDFMRTHSPYGAVWASDKGPITGLSRKIQEAAKTGSGDVYMMYTPMSHVGGDFSTMMTDALVEQIRGGKITKKAKKEFDKEVKNIRPEWKGIDSPEAINQLRDNGALRHVFIDRMNLDQFQGAGFPDLATTRAAITEQSLMDVPIHSGGYSIAKVDPTGRIVAQPVAPHTTYNTQLAGEYVGGFETPIPRELLFSDFTAARRAAGTHPAGDMRSFQLSNPIQYATQEWVDNLMKFMESQKRTQ
jgi:hypothetical protein